MNKKLIEKFRYFVTLNTEDSMREAEHKLIPILDSVGLNGNAEFRKICAESRKEVLSDEYLSEIMSVMFGLFNRLMPNAPQEQVDLFIEEILDKLILDIKMNQNKGGAA
jgi:hypothetical protein